MSKRTAVLAAAVAGAAAFLVVGLFAAGVLGYLLEPDPLTRDVPAALADADRRLGFAQVAAGFVGAVAGGLVGALVAQRTALVHRARRAAVLLGPLAIGVPWLGEAAPNLLVFVIGLVLYVMGAALGAALTTLRGEPAES